MKLLVKQEGYEKSPVHITGDKDLFPRCKNYSYEKNLKTLGIEGVMKENYINYTYDELSKSIDEL